MRLLFAALLTGSLLLARPAFVHAQSTCSPDLLQVVNALNAAQVASAAGDAAQTAHYLRIVRDQLDEMIAACETTAEVTPETADATAEPTAEFTPLPDLGGETVEITSDVTLTNPFLASENLYTVNIPAGYTYSEDTIMYNAYAAAVAAFEPSLGSTLPAGLPPFNVLYGSPLAIAYWSGIVDVSTLETGFAGLASFETALAAAASSEDVTARDVQVYRISVNGNAGIAVRLTAQVQITAEQESIEALFYIVEYPTGLYGAFTAIALAGEMDAQIPTLNAIALSFTPGE